MNQQFSCRNRFSREADLQPVNDYITRAVRYFMRRRGVKASEAFEQTALAFGVSPRKVAQIYYQEPGAAWTAGLRKARDSYLKHLEQRERDFEIAAEETRRERKQLELEI